MTCGNGACSSGRYVSTRTEMLHRKGGSTRFASSFGNESAMCLASSAANPGSAISSTVGQPTETASFGCARPFANTPLDTTRSWLPLPQPRFGGPTERLDSSKEASHTRCGTRRVMRPPRWPLTSDTYVYVGYWRLPRSADALSKGSGSGFGDSLVLFAAPAADADGPHYLASTLKRDSSRENHAPAAVGCVDSVELPARTCVGRQLLGRYVECTGGEGFIYRD